MAALADRQLREFVEMMVQRGLGLYGSEIIAQICYDSGIAFTDTHEIDWLQDDHEKAVNKLLVNYASRNLPAKMTAIVLARKYAIPIPNDLLDKKISGKRKFLSKFRKY